MLSFTIRAAELLALDSEEKEEEEEDEEHNTIMKCLLYKHANDLNVCEKNK